MSTNTAIEWTHRAGTIPATWNPTSGCDKISPGCDNCYALTMAKRLKAMGQAKYQTDGDPRTSGPGFGIAEHPGAVHEPRRWVKPRTVFVNSMSDLFHGGISEGFIGSVWDTMAATPQHTYQILTKRPARARTILNRWQAADWTFRRGDAMWCGPLAGPLANVWLGTSIESADHIDRAHHLRNTPAAVRFISAEPLLGPLDGLDLTGISWLILGGESGPGARPVGLDWFRSLIAVARRSGTAVFVKQLGSDWASNWSWGGQLVSRHDKKGGNWAYWPDDLKIREYPAEVVAS
jgi:protein gp37